MYDICMKFEFVYHKKKQLEILLRIAMQKINRKRTVGIF